MENLIIEVGGKPVPLIITIDGPSGSGKTTIGSMLAQRLNYLFFDTGVMYRAVTWAALQRELDYHNASIMEELARILHIDVQPSDEPERISSRVFVDGQEISESIWQPEIDRTVSMVSGHPGVRVELIRQQRVVAMRLRVVMVGRDVGTVVVPNAPLKIYLRAPLPDRAQRRYNELRSKGIDITLDQVIRDMNRRDSLDGNKWWPERDMWRVDTENCGPEACVDWIIDLFQYLGKPLLL